MSMLLHGVVETHRGVAGTRSRKEKAARLAELLARLDGDDVPRGAAYLLGELPQGKIGLGFAAVRDAAVAEHATEPSLTLAEVDACFDAIAAETGAGSKSRRQERLNALLARATEEEARFLGHLIVGELRQGALEGVVLEAVASATALSAADLRRAAMLGGSLLDVSLAALTRGAEGVAGFRLELLRPLQPMLAQTATSVEDALDRLGTAAFEWKLDGARVQVHRRGDEVRVFTRRLHDVSRAVPEVVELALTLPQRELILDGEVLTLDADGRPLPFQTTMRRFGRRLDVDAMRRELPVTPVFFDVLRLGGESWLERGQAERSEALATLLEERHRTPRLVTDDEEAAEDFYARAIEAGHEGLVAKALDAPYEAGRRGARWLKLKPVHTLDLVVLAAEWGSGRRRGYLSNLHLGARDPESGGFVMLGKTFKGMTDEVLAQQTERLLALETRREDHVVHVRPELVVEIAFDGVQASPHYPGGVALRFARLKRYRADRSAADADTLAAVRAFGRSD